MFKNEIILLNKKFNDFYNEQKKYELNKFRLRCLKKLKHKFDKWYNISIFAADKKISFFKSMSLLFLKSKKSTLYDFDNKIHKIFFKNLSFEKLLNKSTRPKKINYKYTLIQKKYICDNYYDPNNLHNLTSFWIELKKKKEYRDLSINSLIKFLKSDKRWSWNPPHIPHIYHKPRKYNLPLGNLQADVKIIGSKQTNIKQSIYIFDVIDEQSKLVFSKIIKSQKITDILEIVKSAFIFFKKHGIEPRRVRTDNWMAFRNTNFVKCNLFNNFLNKQNVVHEFIPLGEPQCNGVVERFHKTIDVEFVRRNCKLTDIKVFVSKYNDWINFYNKKRNHYYLYINNSFAKKFMTPFKATKFFSHFL